MHCKWKAWVQTPHTTGLSSPGYLASGGQPSKGILQMPQTSSPAFQVHVATACQCFTFTSKVMIEGAERGGESVFQPSASVAVRGNTQLRRERSDRWLGEHTERVPSG